MNLADYISDLLAEHDEVNVPGLGAFMRERVSAYYNDKEAKFYPPHYRVAFVNELKEDSTFTQYLAGKKNISIASAKYFTEKFTTKLKEDAVDGTFIFSGLGSFVTEYGQLVFKPNDQITSDPSFYGYPAVGIDRIGKPKPVEPQKPVVVQPEVVPDITPTALPTTEPEQYVDDVDDIEEEPVQKRRVNIWLILLIVIIAIAGGIFAVYEFYPDVFASFTGNTPPVEKKAKALPAVKPDSSQMVKSTADSTLKTDTASKTDTSAKPVAIQAVNPTDTAKASHWEIIIDTENKEAVAQAAVNQYKQKGVDATIVPVGKKFLVSAGSYPTKAEADAKRLELINARKIYKDSHSLEIKPQK